MKWMPEVGDWVIGPRGIGEVVAAPWLTLDDGFVSIVYRSDPEQQVVIYHIEELHTGRPARWEGGSSVPDAA